MDWFERSHDRIVADLLWVIKSPSLLKSGFGSWKSSLVDQQWMEQRIAESSEFISGVKSNPSLLVQFLKEKQTTQRLGSYFETLLVFWLTHQRSIRKLWTNIPVRSQGATLGEFDLLFLEYDRFFHWEVAVKFYLFFPGENKAHSFFYGPRAKDRFDLKLSKLLNQQMLLSEKKEAKSVLDELGISEVEKRIFVKGRLFYPISISYSEKEIPEGISEEHEKGWWCYFQDVPNFLSKSNARWLILPKRAWLASLELEEDEGAELLECNMLQKECEILFHQFNTAVHVAEFQFLKGRWIEKSRGFIAPDQWPFLTPQNQDCEKKSPPA